MGSYELADLPLNFSNAGERRQKKSYINIIVVVIVFNCVMFDVLVYQTYISRHYEIEKLIFGLALPWTLLLIPIFSLFGTGGPTDRMSLAPPDARTLCINEDGIQVTTYGVARSYLWKEILSVKLVKFYDARGTNPMYNVEITRQRQSEFDTDTTTLDGSLGPTAQDLVGLIQQGIDKWGGQPS
jgi:hypothetical protein